MKILRTSTWAGAFLATLLFVGCGSSNIGDILGGGTSNATNEVRGTVSQVDPTSQSILLTNASTALANGQNSVRVYYDNQTKVSYQGQNYRPTDLEQGDQIDATVSNSSGRLVADAITVTYDISGGGTTAGGYATQVQGTVQYVNTSNRTIQINNGTYNGVTTVQYDNNTPVVYNGQNYRPSDLEKGDQVSVSVQNLGNGQLLAQRIEVLRSVTSTTGTTGYTMQGTVQYVDTSTHTIGLNQVSWGNGFTTNTNGSTVVVEYNNNTQVLYQGRNYTPTNLQRGDVISVQAQNLGNGQYLAQQVTVIQG
ncbi:MAG: DUF5666 domain-containing protein [Thermoanaerobaculia bacterium]